MPASRKSSTIRLQQARQIHLYLGLIFAPSIIFFAFSGALQLFGLHESHPGETYQAPAWIAKIASIHKDQRLAEKHGPPPGASARQAGPGQTGEEQGRPPQLREAGGPRPRGEDRGPGKSTLALKYFFLATALGLIFTTLLGVYMAFRFNRSRRLVWGMLLLGTIIPVALVAMMA